MNDESNTVVFRVVGTPSDRGLVRLHEFNEFCKAIEKMLRATDHDISSTPKTLEYRVTDLQCKSALVSLEAVKPKKGRDRRAKVLSVVRSTFRKLQEGKRPDARLSPRALEAYRDVARPIQRSIGKPIDEQQAVQVDGLRLTTAFLVNIDRFVEKTVRSFGSVSGMLEQLDLHNKSEFVIYPAIGNHKIFCQFKDSLYGDVIDSVKHHVTVDGLLYFHEGKPFPAKVEAKTIKRHPSSDQLPTLTSMAGMASFVTGDSVDLVRALRDE